MVPFGSKADPAGGKHIDYEEIYDRAIAPAIRAAGLDPVRVDAESFGGLIHREQLLLCDFFLAELTTADPRIFYELGVRSTVQPATTVAVVARGRGCTFQSEDLEPLTYELCPESGLGDEQAASLRNAIESRLRELQQADAPDVYSPLLDLLHDWRPRDLARLKTDAFHERVRSNLTFKKPLADIRSMNLSATSEARTALAAFRSERGNLEQIETGTVIDLLLTYRALSDWDGMIALIDDMPAVLQRQILVREQQGFAYNRRAGRTGSDADCERALEILSEVESEQGPSAETCGLIGRIHKDRWQQAREDGHADAADDHLMEAIASYRRGYLTDPRDAYPGINLVTLLDIHGTKESLRERQRMTPIVRFAVERRLDGPDCDYWDHATMLELFVLEHAQEDAEKRLGNVLSDIRETWEPATTVNNLRLVETARSDRGEDTGWIRAIIETLSRRATTEAHRRSLPRTTALPAGISSRTNHKGNP